MAALDPDGIAAADPTGQAGDILALPAHLRDALFRVESAGLEPADAAGIVVAGMGGSSIGARLAVAALGDQLRVPVLLAPSYAPPAFADDAWLVVCASYSGGTEETLAAYDVARERGARRIVATSGGELAERARADGVPVIPFPGGFQPRATVGYALVAALGAIAAGNAAPFPREDLEAAAALAERLAPEWGPAGPVDGAAKALAGRLADTIPVIYGAGLTSAVAYRWKTQLNENAKLPAFSGELPEIDHNEVVGWPAAQGLGELAAVFLEEADGDPRIRARIALTAEIVGGGAAVVERVPAPGATPLERLVALVLLGDLVSLYAGVLRGEDPVTVAPIDRLKAALAAEGAA
jgi:glucose/mannose-6-phosphate isomerase